MFEIIGYMLGLWFFIIVISFCIGMLNVDTDYRKNVTVEDLKKLDEVLRN